jgi:hypothetical protein
MHSTSLININIIYKLILTILFRVPYLAVAKTFHAIEETSARYRVHKNKLYAMILA